MADHKNSEDATGSVADNPDVGYDACTAADTTLCTSQAKQFKSATNIKPKSKKPNHHRRRPQFANQRTFAGIRMEEALPELPSNTTVENVWHKLQSKARKKIKLHEKKAEAIQSKIREIDADSMSRPSSTTGVQFTELIRQKLRSLQEKACELELQQTTFSRFMEGLEGRLTACSLNSNWHAKIKKFCTEFDLEVRQFQRSLPIYARKFDVLETIVNNQVCVILGETGSGKSTQILQYIYAAGFHQRGIVACTQPRKVAAITLARRVSEEMGNTQGLVRSTVNVQSSRNRKLKIPPKLLYATDYLIVNECLEDPLLSKYSVIVVDEVHERSIHSDLLLGFLKLALPKRTDLRVVVMSATINADLFVSYFSNISNQGDKPPVLEISGSAFPVDVYYEKSSKEYVNAACLKALDIHRNEHPTGNILVFLTSPFETEQACRNLIMESAMDAASLQAVELHGRLTIEEQQKIFKPALPGKRKIVFATNVAETSITIPGIKYVVDTGRAKERSYNAKRNASSLSVKWVTKSSAEQRKGRAGRTDWGKCYRLYSEEEFSQMREQTVPEILKIHVGQAILKLMTLGISNPMDFDFVEEPSRDALESALSALRDLDACDINGITEVGKKLAKLPLEPRLGKAVLSGIKEGIPLESVVMAAVCTVGGTSVFLSGRKMKQKQAASGKEVRFCDEWGDIITLVNVYVEWVAVPETCRSKWCAENGINVTSMTTVNSTVSEIRQILQMELGIEIQREVKNVNASKEKMARILYECYSSNLSRFSGHGREGFFLANLPSTVLHVHPSSAVNYMDELPTWVVYEHMFTTSRTFLMNATRVKEEWVRESISTGKLKLSLDCLSSFVLEPLPVQHVGDKCIQDLLFGKAKLKKDLEEKAKSVSVNSKCCINITSCKERYGGPMTWYATPNCHVEATSLLQSYLQDARKSLANDYVEGRLSPNSTVRFLLDCGGEIRTILLPDDTRIVKVMLTSNVQLTETTVRTKLSQFGDIESIKRDYAQKDVWGMVLFKLPEQAENALKCKDPCSDLTLEPAAYRFATASREYSQNFYYTVTVEATRCPLRGYGFVEYENVSSASLVGDELAKRTVILRKDFGQGKVFENIVTLERDTTSTKLVLRSIPTWANEKIVRTSLENAIDNHSVKITSFILPRENIAPDDQWGALQRSCRSVRQGGSSSYRTSCVALATCLHRGRGALGCSKRN